MKCAPVGGCAIGVCKATNGALADAFTERGDDFNLLGERKIVHGGSYPTCGTDPKRDSGKLRGNPLYLPEWSRLRGPIPGLRSGSAAVCAVTDPLVEGGAGSEDRTQVVAM
jgi:hypothetical protein